MRTRYIFRSSALPTDFESGLLRHLVASPGVQAVVDNLGDGRVFVRLDDDAPAVELVRLVRGRWGQVSDAAVKSVTEAAQAKMEEAADVAAVAHHLVRDLTVLRGRPVC